MISADLKLSSSLRKRLRKYFLRMRSSSEKSTWRGLVERMSPQLRRDASREVHRHWVLRVKFISTLSIDFVTEVTQELQVLTFTEFEHFGEPHHMYVLTEGMA